jgi:hypothetical protein
MQLFALGGGEEITLANALACTNSSNCPEPLVAMNHLQFQTTLELMEEEGLSFFIDLWSGTGGAIEIEVECMGSGASDACTGNVALELQNEGTNVHGLFSETFNTLAGGKLGTCTTGGVEAFIIEGLVIILLTEGGTLAVSSE